MSAVKIQITSELLQYIFSSGVKHYEIINGISADHKVRGVIQNPDNGSYYLLFSTDDNPEGTIFENLSPTVRNFYKEAKKNENDDEA